MSRIRIVGGKITITTIGAHHMYSDENIVFSSSKMVTEVGDENGVVYGDPNDSPIVSKYKKILSIKWMCGEMINQISSANIGSKVSLLVKTSNYDAGENISLKIKEVDEGDINASGIKEIVFTGVVNEDGFAELKEELTIEN